MLSGLPERLAHYRRMNNMTQKDLAEKCEVERTYLNSVENARQRPSAEMLFRLADNTDMNMDWLIRGVGPMQSVKAIDDLDLTPDEVAVLRDFKTLRDDIRTDLINRFADLVAMIRRISEGN